jgi:epoxyqueuosine reductase QueG
VIFCQEVCPFNRRKNVSKKTTKEFSFLLREEIKNIIHQLPEKEEWENLKNSPLKRVKYEIFKENYKNILKYEYTQC